MIITEAYNFIQINNHLSCSGLLKNIDLQSLSKSGYEVVINLLPDNDKHATGGEKESIEGMGLKYIHIPIDWNEPTNSNFESFKSSMDSNKNRKIHIHCAANYRASAFYALYAHKNHGWSESKLSEFIGSIWETSEYPVWERFISDISNV